MHPTQPYKSSGQNKIIRLIVILIIIVIALCAIISCITFGLPALFVWLDADKTGGRWCMFPFSIIGKMLGAVCP